MKPWMLSGLLAFAILGLVGYNTIWHGYYHKNMQRVAASVARENATQHKQAEVASVIQQVEQYRKQLAPTADPSWLANQVIAIGEQSGLRKFNTDQQPLQETAQYTRLAVLLEFQATYHQLGTFLDALERAEHLFRVERLDMAQGRADSDLASITLVVSTLSVPPVVSTAGK